MRTNSSCKCNRFIFPGLLLDSNGACRRVPLGAGVHVTDLKKSGPLKVALMISGIA